MELRQELIEGRAELPRVGAVVPARGVHPPYIVVNAYDDEIEAATAYLRDLALNDCSRSCPAEWWSWIGHVTLSGCVSTMRR